MKRTIRYILSAALTVVFLVLAFRGVDADALWDAARHARYAWFVLFLVTLLISHLLRALRWRYLLDPVKPSIGLRNLFSGVMIGYLLNNVLPRAGEIARPYAIAHLESIPASAAFGTVVVERIMDIITFLLIVVILPLLYTGPLLETFPWLVPTGIAASVAIAAAVTGFLTLMVRRDWTDRLLRVAVRLVPARLERRFTNGVHAFLNGFLFVRRPGSFLAIGVLSVLIWFLYVVMMYLAFFAFGLDATLNFGAAVVVLAISSIGTAVPTPGGTGSYHILVSQSLTRLFGVEPALALGYATITHAMNFLGSSVVGAWFF
ncbi:MAG TPA: lysylphosphatidylglycerol synthase transmembrane domain-containing protein, partial [Bacteroidota bacterium]